MRKGSAQVLIANSTFYALRYVNECLKENSGIKPSPHDISTIKHSIRLLAVTMEGRILENNLERKPTVSSVRGVARRFIPAYNWMHRDESPTQFQMAAVSSYWHSLTRAIEVTYIMTASHKRLTMSKYINGHLDTEIDQSREKRRKVFLTVDHEANRLYLKTDLLQATKRQAKTATQQGAVPEGPFQVMKTTTLNNKRVKLRGELCIDKGVERFSKKINVVLPGSHTREV